MKHGHVVTDTIADWVKSDFVAGPFSSPPFKNFRSNCLVAIEQPNKVRPVLDISLPKGHSFNDNVSKHLVEKTKMATAHNFAYSLREAGLGAVMSKFDAKDAYKMIPAPIQDYPSQGFCWLGRYFFEKKTNLWSFHFCSKLRHFQQYGKKFGTLLFPHPALSCISLLR
jgi:hypothetical protein